MITANDDGISLADDGPDISVSAVEPVSDFSI